MGMFNQSPHLTRNSGLTVAVRAGERRRWPSQPSR
jgi:hypothetical protein